jgi:hypothetical protein
MVVVQSRKLELSELSALPTDILGGGIGKGFPIVCATTSWEGTFALNWIIERRPVYRYTRPGFALVSLVSRFDPLPSTGNSGPVASSWFHISCAMLDVDIVMDFWVQDSLQGG